MKKQILAELIVGMMVATPVWGAKNKVVKIGERPESLTKGFGGKYYVTVMNSPDKERTLWPIDSNQAKELPAQGCVYKISIEDGKITDAIAPGQADMPGPNGVGRSGKTGLLMGDFFTGNIVRKTAKGKLRVITKGLRGADAVDPDGKGGIYVSSWTQGKVWKLTNNGKKKEVVLEGLKSAADFYLDRKAKKLIVPDMLAGTLIFVDIK